MQEIILNIDGVFGEPALPFILQYAKNHPLNLLSPNNAFEIFNINRYSIRMIRENVLNIISDAIDKTTELDEYKNNIDFVIERPRNILHGDWSTNIALNASKILKKNPMIIAEAVASNIDDKLGIIKSVDIAKPGFINLTFTNDWYFKVLKNIEELNDSYGKVDYGKNKKVLIEYVSANPVGPLHIGHGRWAAVGDTLSNVLKTAGFKVDTEFYINNFGRQMNLYFKSVESAYRNLFGEDTTPPEDGYQGLYINDIANHLKDKLKEPLSPQIQDKFEKEAYEFILNQIKNTLINAGVHFDNYFSEKEELQNSNAVNDSIEYLKTVKKDNENAIYEKDGALWLHSTLQGDEKDRVIKRSNGEYTYFAADIAYHQNKIKRGYDQLINIWGADHHGYIARVKAAIAFFGEDPDKLIVLLGQLVNLLKSGKPVRMSKRTGDLITLDELIQEVGKDAVRYNFLTKSTDTTLDFDIDVAKEQSDKNPVYYVQYAHARICSIMKVAEEKGVDYKNINNINLNILSEKDEINLIKVLEEFEDCIISVSKNYTPHLLTAYAHKVAQNFHSYYAKHRVVSDDKELTLARLSLLNATHIVLRNVLALLGVSAPEKM